MLTALFAFAYFPSLFDTLETHSHFGFKPCGPKTLHYFHICHVELCSSASHFHLQCLYSDSFDCFKKCLYFRSLDVKSIGAVSVLADEDMIQRRDFRQFPAADVFGGSSGGP
jgi:hypothetical protein